MKARKPSIPKGAPEGTVWSGGPIDWSCITLKISGENLDPEEVSRLLRPAPDPAHPEKERNAPGKEYPLADKKKRGWRIRWLSTDTDEWDVDVAIGDLMQALNSDIATWQSLSSQFRVELSIKLSMRTQNKGFCLSPGTMRYLGDRHIEAGFDVYYEVEQEE